MVHARNIVRRIPSARLVALCDADVDAMQRAAEELGVARNYIDYREAVSSGDVDAVLIVTPTFLHREIACEAAAHGKHVFLEKPMAITVEECQAINAAAGQAGIKLQVGFMRRFDESFLHAKEILESGAMGRVMIVKSTGRGPGLPPPWIFDIGKSNGIIAEVNSHDLDSVRWLAGSDVARVYAEAANFKCPEAKEQFPDFYDNIVVTLRFMNQTMGVVDGTCPSHYGYDARVEILCEKGVLFIGSTEQHGVVQVSLDGQVTARAVKSWRDLFREAYVAEIEDFIRCVLDDREPRVTGLDGLRAVEAVVAANASLKTRAPVELQKVSIR
jgi:predicted dehydrogenase